MCLNQAQNLNRYPIIDTVVVKSLEQLQTSESDLDKHNIRKLYSDATGDRKKQAWYFDDMVDDKGKKINDRLGNEKNANLKKEDDGSWSVTGAKEVKKKNGKSEWLGKGQVRLEGWSEAEDRNKKWLNMEITVYAFYEFDLKGRNKQGKALMSNKINYAFQLYGRGGTHSSKRRCEGACYKIGVRKDGAVAVRKEVNHPFYLTEMGKKKGTEKDVKGRWIGLKQVLYNYKHDDKECVANEVWIDDESDDNGGKLKVLNKWRNVSNVNDIGKWGMEDLKQDYINKNFERTCEVLDTNVDQNESHKHRQAEDIINEPGGTDNGNIGSLRSDIIKLKFKFFSIREIEPPQPDKHAEEAMTRKKSKQG